MIQFLAIAQTAYSAFVEYAVILHRVVIGIGAMCSQVTKFGEICKNSTDDGTVHTILIKAYWIIGIAVITKRSPKDGIRMVSFGIGIVPLIPMLSIGVIK